MEEGAPERGGKNLSEVSQSHSYLPDWTGNYTYDVVQRRIFQWNGDLIL